MSATLPVSYEPFFPSPFAERPAALKPCPLGYESSPSASCGRLVGLRVNTEVELKDQAE